LGSIRHGAPARAVQRDTLNISRSSYLRCGALSFSGLILDVTLRGESGLTFQEQVAKSGVRMPIVFTTEYRDIAITVKAMKAGTVEFFAKPFRDQDMLDAAANALERGAPRG
jgi:FixJ family two-component response regulator